MVVSDGRERTLRAARDRIGLEPAHFREMHIVIRPDGPSFALAEGTRILYRGSVNAANADDLFA